MHGSSPASGPGGHTNEHTVAPAPRPIPSPSSTVSTTLHSPGPSPNDGRLKSAGAINVLMPPDSRFEMIFLLHDATCATVSLHVMANQKWPRQPPKTSCYSPLNPTALECLGPTAPQSPHSPAEPHQSHSPRALQPHTPGISHYSPARSRITCPNLREPLSCASAQSSG